MDAQTNLPDVASEADWLIDGGEMGALVRSFDWSATPLGPIATWPPSLRTAVSLVLQSSLPISLTWGPEHTQIYNDHYRPFCGEKHPAALGHDLTQTWASAMPVIGDHFRSAVAGRAASIEDQRMFLDRRGFLEETCFTFSFSPIRDESGAVAGLFHPVIETTGSMLAQRRTGILRELESGARSADSMIQGLRGAATVLAGAAADLPFVLFYQAAADGLTAELVASHGLPIDGPGSPRTVDLRQDGSGWPLARVLASREAELIELIERDGGPLSGLVCAPYPEPIRTAAVLPITPHGYGGPDCVMVAGASPRLPMNDTYRSFYAMVAAAISTVIVNATAISVQRGRAEALAQLDRAKTAFFQNVSHEFRTPLTLMLGPLQDELADLDDAAPPHRRERLEAAHRNSQRLLRLVNTLLDFARMEEGRSNARFQRTNVSTLTTDIAGAFRSACERAGLDLIVQCEPVDGDVYLDHDMWEGIVLNLLSNALKFTTEGAITVTTQRAGSAVELTVRDTGIGIPPEELPRIFERFHRVPQAPGRSHEGAGIGLAFVQQLAAQHGGAVRAWSEVGTGTAITVSIPIGAAHLPDDQIQLPDPSEPAQQPVTIDLRAQDQPEQRPQAELRPQPSAGPAAAAGPRILWADDNADMRQYVTRLLAGRYDVKAVADGQSALESALRRVPDLVLADVMMPQLDGFGLLRALRADERTAAIPVILLSARAGEEAVVDGLAAGADDYLVKPFTARELLARIGTHLKLAARTAELAAANQGLASANSDLAAANALLASANKELESFTYSVSHDLRAPLRAIDGFTRILLDQYGNDLPDEANRYFGMVRANSQRMALLIDELLAFARLGRKPIVKREVDVSGLVESCWAELAIERADRRVELAVSDLPPCTADPLLLRQVWMNLLGNAVKYTRRREVAHISVGAEGAGAELGYYCRDDGAGFDMRYAAKIFGVFQRLHRIEEFEGTGVGLAIVEQIVRRHGGRVWAEAEPDQGAVFHFTV